MNVSLPLWNLQQCQDIELFSSEEDSSLYFTYSGGCNELEVNNLHYEVSEGQLHCTHTQLSLAFNCLNFCMYVCVYTIHVHTVCAICVNVCLRVFTGRHSSSDPLVWEVVRVQVAMGDERKQADSHQQTQSQSTQRADAGHHRQLRWDFRSSSCFGTLHRIPGDLT